MTFDDWWERNARAVVRSPSGFARMVWKAAQRATVPPTPVDDMKGLKAGAVLRSLGYVWDGRAWMPGGEIDKGEPLQLVAREVTLL